MIPEEKIKRAKIQILQDNPFFAYLSLYLKFREAKKGELPEWAGMGVDARGNCFYNKEFVDKISDKEIQSVILHEVMHCSFLHLLRLGNRIPEKWNIAVDCVVNYILKQNNFSLPEGCLEVNYDNSIEIFGQKIENVDKKTPEQIYDELKFKVKKIKIGISIKGKGQGKGDKEGGGNGFDVHIYGDEGEDGEGKKGKKGKKDGGSGCKISEEEKKQLEKEWKERLAEAYVSAKNAGKVPAGIERLIGEVHRNEIDWRTILLREVQNTIPYDYSYATCHKKSCSAGYYIPNVTREEIDIVVGVDVSGCFVGDTLIYTDEGIEEIKSINKEKVINSDFLKNSLEQVTKKFNYKTNKLIKIKTKSGKEILCTPNHKIFVYENPNKKWRKSPKWHLNKGKMVEKRADEILEGYYLISQNKIEFPQNEVIMPEIKYNSKYLSTPKQREDILNLAKKYSGYEIAKMLNLSGQRVYNVIQNKGNILKHPIMPFYFEREFTELLGYICGDGFINLNKNCCYVQITDKNLENLEYYKKIAEKYNIPSYIRNLSGRQRLNLCSKEFALYLKEYFPELTERSPKRHIPKIITKCKDDVIKGFIRGLFDSEGHIQEHTFVITNTSKRLLQEAQILLERIGIQSYIERIIMPERKIGEGTIKETIFYKLCISTLNNMNNFCKEIGVTRSDKKELIKSYMKDKKINLCRTRINFNDYLNLEPIKSIERLDVENVDVYDLEIENKHNYFANGILVHNSIGKEEYTDFISEIIGMAKEFRGRIKMRILTHETSVNDDYIIENGNIEKIKNLEIHGGGGTSHKAVFEYISEKIRNTKLVIFLTDGYSDLNEIDFEKYNFNKVFVISKAGSEEQLKDKRVRIIKLKGEE